MDSGRWGILGHRAPFLTGPGGAPGSQGMRDAPSREFERGRSRPRGWRRLSPRSPGAPRLPLPPHPQPKAGKTRNLGSRAEATDQVRARVEGSGRNCVATVGGVGGRQSPGWWGFQSDDTRVLVTGLRPLRRSQIPCTSWVLTVPGPLVSAMTRPLGSPQGPAAAAPLCKQLLSRTLASDAPAEPPAAPPSW